MSDMWLTPHRKVWRPRSAWGGGRHAAGAPRGSPFWEPTQQRRASKNHPGKKETIAMQVKESATRHIAAHQPADHVADQLTWRPAHRPTYREERRERKKRRKEKERKKERNIITSSLCFFTNNTFSS